MMRTMRSLPPPGPEGMTISIRFSGFQSGAVTAAAATELSAIDAAIVHAYALSRLISMTLVLIGQRCKRVLEHCVGVRKAIVLSPEPCKLGNDLIALLREHAVHFGELRSSSALAAEHHVFRADDLREV